MKIEDTWPPYLRWLQRAIYPHGVRCLWRCSPWHKPGNYPTWEQVKEADSDLRADG